MTDEQRNIECTKLLTIVHELDRMIRAEIARNDQMRAQIAALREQWQARQNAWMTEFDEEMQKAGRAERSLILAGQRYAMACVLEELDALFPPEVINEEKAS
jgi:hypothetical protein